MPVHFSGGKTPETVQQIGASSESDTVAVCMGETRGFTQILRYAESFEQKILRYPSSRETSPVNSTLMWGCFSDASSEISPFSVQELAINNLKLMSIKRGHQARECRPGSSWDYLRENQVASLTGLNRGTAVMAVAHGQQNDDTVEGLEKIFGHGRQP
ncbi:hypothetical protein DFH06DRAFT_1136538 [Mycena polygramma]|nr:hypothetical protein DFH06DRAFT_1136538 [Mycena polygramma]